MNALIGQWRAANVKRRVGKRRWIGLLPAGPLTLGLVLCVLSGCASGPPPQSGYGPPYEKPEPEPKADGKACIYVRCGVNPEYEYDGRYCCINGPQD